VEKCRKIRLKPAIFSLKTGFLKTASLRIKSARLQTSIRKPAVEHPQACGLIPQGYRMLIGYASYLF
jgi:hypothetical protein